MNLADALSAVGYTLLRHDPDPKPGHVASYLAINRHTKIAVIGVRGTSSFADILTDCCASPVPYILDAPFCTMPNGEAGTTIHCHEGICVQPSIWPRIWKFGWKNCGSRTIAVF